MAQPENTNRIIGLESHDDHFSSSPRNYDPADQGRKRSNLNYYILVPILVFLLGIISYATYYYFSKKNKAEDSKMASLRGMENEKDEINMRKLQPSDVPADNELLQAIQLYKTGYEKSAQAGFQDIVESSKPDKVKAYALIYLGLIADDNGKYNLAIDYFERSLKFDNNNYYAYYNSAITLRHKGLYKEAIEVLSKAEKLKPVDSEAKILRGILEYQSNDLESAERSLKDANNSTEDPKARYALALLYKEKGKIAEAKSLFLDILSIASAGKYAYKSAAQLSIINAEQGDFDNAKFYIKKAIELNSQNPSYYYNWALIEYKTNNPETAVKALDNALRLGKDDAKTYVYIANLFAEMGKFERAENTLQIAKEKFPSNELVLSQLADILIENAKWDEAIAVLKKLFNSSTKSETKNYARFNLGKVYAQLNEWDKAEKYLQESIEADNLNEDAIVALGEVYMKQGKSHLAISQYKAALKRNPDNLKVLKGLAQVYVKNGLLEESEDMLTRLTMHPMKQAEDLAFAYFELGKIQHLRKNYDSAIKFFEKVLERKDSYLKFDALLKLAEAILDGKKPAVIAMPYLRQAISMAPDRFEARFLLAKALVEDGSLSSQERAEEELTAVIISCKDSYLLSKAFTLRGIIYYKQAVYLKALNDFESALEADASNDQAFKNRQAAAARLENG